MEYGAYNTTVLYHNKLSNIHDIESYIIFMKYAWVDYADVICAFILCGLIIGVVCAKYFIETHSYKGGE